jgi:hypothetical protein
VVFGSAADALPGFVREARATAAVVLRKSLRDGLMAIHPLHSTAAEGEQATRGFSAATHNDE